MKKLTEEENFLRKNTMSDLTMNNLKKITSDLMFSNLPKDIKPELWIVEDGVLISFKGSKEFDRIMKEESSLKMKI